jgi:methionyl-tRNA formyltransferase
MKIVFAGTPEFAAQAMRAIYDAGHHIVLALTQPDRPAGRGMHLQASPVKQFAIEKNIPVIQPETLRRTSTDIQKKAQADEAYQRLMQTDFDAMVVVAYGLILPQEILDISERSGRYGSFNIHASLLPRWRGAAPIQRAIKAGDQKTGVCIMQMDAGLDTGSTVLIDEVQITSDDTSTTLHDKLAALGAKLIVDALAQLDSGRGLAHTLQPTDNITYAEKILKSEAEIDWLLEAKTIDAQIRAFNPFPGSTSGFEGQMMKFWNSALAPATLHQKQGKPGEVLGFGGQGIYVQCGAGVIEILEIQKPGGKKISAKAWLQSIEDTKQPIYFHALSK